MGQIVGGSAKTKRCNIRQLSQLGTPSAGEHILVSSDNSMNAAGQGNFDYYIVGDGQKAATALKLIPTENVAKQLEAIFSGSVSDEYTVSGYGAQYFGSYNFKAGTEYTFLIETSASATLYFVICDAEHNTIRANEGVSGFPKTIKWTPSQDYDGACLYLRNGGTNTYTITVTGGGVLTRLENTERQAEKCYYTLGIADIYNGSNGNSANTDYVHTQVIPTNGAEYVTLKTTRQNRTGCHYVYGYAITSSLSDIGSSDMYSRWVGGIGKVDLPNADSSPIVDLSAFPSAVGISFTIGEVDVNNSIQSLRLTDFSDSVTQIDCNSQGSVVIVNNTTEGGATKALSAEMGKQLQTELNAASNAITLLNGSTGNPGNAQLVRTSVLPTNGARFIFIKTTRPNRDGCHYGYGVALTSSTSDIGKTTSYASFEGSLLKIDVASAYTDNFIDLQKYPSAVGIAFTIGEYNSSDTLQTLRTTDFDSYLTSLMADKDTEKLISAYEIGSVVERNREREIALQAMCRYRKNTSPIKDLQLCICTDSHNDTLSVNNAVSAVNGFLTIDGMVHAGDICAIYFSQDNIASFHESLSFLKKPAYIVIGNHDVGNAYYVGYCCNHAQAYEAFIKPMVDNGWLTTGEYTENKPYWYHDFSTYKVRIIGLYEYDDNLDFNETYWRAITYNSELSNIAVNTAYSIGTQINVQGYTEHSFEAVQAVTTPTSFYTTPEKFPSYKVLRGNRVIRQEQAQWFLNTLASTPANYGVVVITHNPFSDDAALMDVKFAQYNSSLRGVSFSQNSMETDFINDALVAFASGIQYSANIKMKGDATYLNTEGGNSYAYTVSKDFSVKNAGVKVYGLIGGHSHRDLVWQKGNLIQIAPICATTHIGNAANSDIRREETDGLTKDSLTVISFAKGRIGLAKIGVNVTEDGKARDYEVIPVSE